MILLNGQAGPLKAFANGTIAYANFRSGNVLGIIANFGEEDRFFVDISSDTKWSLIELQSSDVGFVLTGAQIESTATAADLFLNETPIHGDIALSGGSPVLVLGYNMRKVYLDLDDGSLSQSAPRAVTAVIRNWRVVQPIQGKQEMLIHLQPA